MVPVGAIVFAEHQLFPRIGYTRYWAKYQDYAHSLPAVGSWIVGLIFGFGLNALDVISFYYLFIPTWIFTIIVYTGWAGQAGAKQSFPVAEAKEVEFNQLVKAYQNKRAAEAPVVKSSTPMLAKVLTAIALTALAITLILAGIVVFGSSTETLYKANRDTFYFYGFICTLVYFGCAIWSSQIRKAEVAHVNPTTV